MWLIQKSHVPVDGLFCSASQRCSTTEVDYKKIPTPSHLIINLDYRLKPHHTRNLYLRARLDTCADVNIMPASECKLVFKYPRFEEACS